MQQYAKCNAGRITPSKTTTTQDYSSYQELMGMLGRAQGNGVLRHVAVDGGSAQSSNARLCYAAETARARSSFSTNRTYISTVLEPRRERPSGLFRMR